MLASRNVTLIQTAIGERDGTAHLYQVKSIDQMASQADWNLLFASLPTKSSRSLVVELGLANRPHSEGYGGFRCDSGAYGIEPAKPA